MHTYQYLPVAAAVMLGCGCSHLNVTTYSGTIQRVETGEFLGYTVSPVSNSASPVVHPVHVFVSVVDRPTGKPRIVRIDFPDAPDRSAFGQPGDRVKFDFRGALPVDGHIAAGAVSRYAVGTGKVER